MRFPLIIRRYLAPLVMMAFFGLVVAQVGSAGEKTASGKDLYKQNCRVCHEKGSAHGEYSPSSLIQDQWENFFKDKLARTHKDTAAPGQDGKKLLDTLTPEQLKEIHKFCVEHAADSEQPQTCS
jgi:mono/diheme cytochrome c family protein